MKKGDLDEILGPLYNDLHELKEETLECWNVGAIRHLVMHRF